MRSPIELREAERRELRQRVASRSGRVDDGRRARLILLLAQAPPGFVAILFAMPVGTTYTHKTAKLPRLPPRLFAVLLSDAC
jgi:hypothetical protein